MQANTKKTLKIYLQHSKRHWPSFTVGILSVVGGSAVNAITPIYFKKFFDVLSLGGSTAADALIRVLILIAFLEFGQWLFWRVSGFAMSIFEARTLADLADTCFAYLHKHSFTYFNNNFVGSLVKRVNWFVRAFEDITDHAVYELLSLLVNLVIILVVLCLKNIYLGLGLLVWCVIFSFVNWKFTKYKLQFDNRRNEMESAATGFLADTITNNSTVKLFCGYGREVKNYAGQNANLTKIRKHTWFLQNYFEAIMTFMVIALEIAMFYGAILLWQAGRATIGDFVLIQSYLVFIFIRIWSYGKIIQSMYTRLSDAEEMTVILNTPHEIQDKPKAKELKVTDGKIEFVNVGFSYNQTRSILEKFNLEIAPREKVALVGPSGAGKTTIVKLILRMHEVESGKILIDGQKVMDVTQESLWQNVSYVPQDPILFHRSLLENIRYGKPDATDAEVFAAARHAHCHEFISGFPEGYNTFVGERGVKLSGGERQRVAIARAILRNAPILILDEATSSLDSESERLIQDALSTLMKNKTVIVVAHRLSTIMKMDRIVVMDEGGIEEQGTHRQLLQKKTGIYKKLWNIQAGGFIE